MRRRAQATIYLNASIQFEQSGANLSGSWGYFSTRTEFSGKALRNLNMKSMSHAVECKTTLLNNDRKNVPYVTKKTDDQR